MQRMYRYVLVRLMSAFLAALAGSAGLLGIGAMVRMMRLAPRWGVTGMTVVKALPVVILQQLSFAFPLACAAASTLVFSEMAQDNELLAVESTGRDSRRLLRPFLPLGIILTLLAFGIEEVGWGWGMEKVAEMFLKDAAHSAERSFRSGHAVSPDSRGRYWLATVGGEKGRKAVFAGFEDGEINQVFAGGLSDFYWDGNEHSINMELYRAEGFRRDAGTMRIEHVRLSMGVEMADPSLPHSRDPSKRSILRNYATVKNGASSEHEFLRALAGLHTNLGLILAAMPLLVLGAAFGVRVRFSGRAAAFAWSVMLVLLVYYPVWITSRKMVQNGSVEAGVMPYLLDLAALAAGILMFRKWVENVE